jgi:hypothetical protein
VRRCVEEFNSSGEYITQFGSAGSGAGQFNFSYPIGIEAGPKFTDLAAVGRG